MDVDQGHGSSVEDVEEADESDDGESSTEEESDVENRSPLMSSDSGSDEGEEDDSGHSEEDESIDETEQDALPTEDVYTLLNELEAMKHARPAIDWKSTYPFFYYKFASNTSDTSYEQLRQLLNEWHIDVRSLKTTREDLQQRLHLRMQKYDACINGCMAFTGEHKLRGLCPHCCKAPLLEPRFHYSNSANAPEFYENLSALKELTPRATYCYLPLIPCLQLLYASKEWLKKMGYPKKLLETPFPGGVRDIWDGEMMKRWIAKGYFGGPDNERSVALQFSTDGVQLFRNSTYEAWPFLVINLNLPPEDRYSTDNFLPLGLSRGPSSPSDLDSFLHPFLEELKLLHEGVPAYDAYKEEAFILKAHLVLITGHTPAISKLMCFSGHSAKLPCCACKIEGVPFKIGHKKKTGQAGEITHHYFALLPPTWFPEHFTPANKLIYRLHPSYTVNDLPLRTPSNYRSDALADDATKTGVKGISPLSLIPTSQVPYSCPYNVMHLVYLGFVRDLFRLLTGSFFKDKTLNLNSPVSNSQWQELGREMGKIEAPTGWGRPPRDISKYIKGFKAEELSNFATQYMLPLFHSRVNRPTFTALRRFIMAMSLATNYIIKLTEIQHIDTLLKQFITWFYDKFYGREYDRLQICKYTVHALLHLSREVCNWGSASYFWQYSEECLCGVLIHAIKSRVHGSANLSVLTEQHQLISFATKFGFFLSSASRDPSKEFRLNQPGYESISFLPPAKLRRLHLTDPQLKHLKKHYITTCDGLRTEQDPRLMDMDTTVQVWLHCCVDKEVFHCEQNRLRNSTRLNHLAHVWQTTDRNANFREGVRPEVMEAGDYYIYIKFFCVYEFEGVTSMLFYGEYRHVEIIEGLVKDAGSWVDGFLDVFTLENLCGRYTRGAPCNQTIWLIDDQLTMRRRMMNALHL